MKYKLKKWLIILLAVLAAVIPVTLEVFDHYLSGDEVVTYSMANNLDGGFVFSEGRVAGYMKDYIFADSLPGTFSNLIREAEDVLKNRKNARFFTYSPDPEVRYYTHDQMQDWFEKRNYERFNVADTWLFSQSDDANSYLYYSLLNIAGSLIQPISGTKWIGFVLNMLLYALLLFSLWKLTGGFLEEKSERILATLLCGLSYEVLTRLIYIRPYLLAMCSVIWIAVYHLSLWKTIRKKKENAKFRFFLLIPLMMAAYISHYTTAVVLIAFAAVTLIVLFRNQKRKEAGTYFLTCVLSGLCAILIDPVSLAGLLMKFTSSGSAGAGSFLNDLLEYGFHSLFPTAVFPVWAILLLVLSKGRGLQDYWADERLRLLTFVFLVFAVIVVAGTKGIRYLAVMTPLFTLAIVTVLLFSQRHIEKGSPVLTAVTVILFAGLSTALAFASLTSANAKDAALRAALAAQKEDDCIYFRVRRSGYEIVPYISMFDHSQVVTITTDQWETMVNEDILKNDSLLVFFDKESHTDETEAWLKEHGYRLSEVYSIDTSEIYEAVR